MVNILRPGRQIMNTSGPSRRERKVDVGAVENEKRCLRVEAWRLANGPALLGFAARHDAQAVDVEDVIPPDSLLCRLLPALCEVRVMRVYVTRRLPREAVDILRSEFEVTSWDEEGEPVPRAVLLREVAWVDGLLSLLTERVDEELLERAPRLKIVANMAVGYDNVDVSACSKRGILVTNTPDVLTEATADLAIALLLATARRLVETRDVLMAGGWKSWSPMFLTGEQVHGATVGIIGMGRIGRAVARRARGFSMRVLYHSRSRDEDAERETGAEYVRLERLLGQSDFVSIHLPLTAETKHFISAREMSLMKPSAVLVNTSRGAVVDEKALIEALRAGRIRAAGLDVFETEPLPMDSPLRHMKNVVLLPHIGSATVRTRTDMAVLAARNISEYLRTGKALTPVNAEAMDGQ